MTYSDDEVRRWWNGLSSKARELFKGMGVSCHAWFQLEDHEKAALKSYYAKFVEKATAKGSGG